MDKVTRVLGIAFQATILVACSGDPEERAGELYVEAAEAISEVAVAEYDFDRQLELLESAHANAELILNDFPGTPAALRVAADNRIGSMSLDAITTQITRLRNCIIGTEIEAAILCRIVEATGGTDRPASFAKFQFQLGAYDIAITSINQVLGETEPSGTLMSLRGSTSPVYDQSLRDWVERLDPDVSVVR